MADFDRGNRDYPYLNRLYIMRCARVPNRVFSPTFGTVVDNRSKIDLHSETQQISMIAKEEVLDLLKSTESYRDERTTSSGNMDKF